MTRSLRQAVAWVLGAVLVGTLAVVVLRARGGDGFLLAPEDVRAAREHLRLCEDLARLDAALPPDGTAEDEASLARQADRALLASHLRHSRFAGVAVEDLRRGLEAAAQGRFRAPPDGIVQRGVYGVDDRLDHDAVQAKWEAERATVARARLEGALANARSVGAWMHRGTLRGTAAPRTIVAPTLGQFFGLCSNERFADQPRAALGTAFLVGPDTVATAAHILRGEHAVPLAQLVLTFDFEVRDGQPPLAVGEVYRPLRIRAIDAGHRDHDWAIVQLDRPVADGRPLALARDTRGPGLRTDAQVYMWGHSAGTPKKFAEGRVTANAGRSNSIRIHLDAFGGDSGSPLFNREHEVIGMLFGGSEDFVAAPARGGCRVAAQVASSTLGEYVTRVELFRDELRR